MKTGDLMIRCLAKRENDHWVAICLPFDLAVQGATRTEVRQKLEAQIRDYLQDALLGEDREHAEYLLNRRAPMKYWLAYWWSFVRRRVTHGASTMLAYKTAVPLAPVPC